MAARLGWEVDGWESRGGGGVEGNSGGGGDRGEGGPSEAREIWNFAHITMRKGRRWRVNIHAFLI
jgi:hypothetical protein